MQSNISAQSKAHRVPKLVKDGESIAPAGSHTEFMEELSTLMGGAGQDLALPLLNTGIRALPSREDGKVTAANDLIAAIGAIGPRDGLENMMACAAGALFQHAMSLLGRAGTTSLSGLSEVRLALSDKLFRQFLAHVRAIDAHRRQLQPQQHIVVEHVHVEQGGQMAIMGQVQTGGGVS
jgi:hypothetical protein